MKISTSKDEIDLTGDAADLRDLSLMIANFLKSTESMTLTIDTFEDFDPAPYDRAISKMIIRKENGKLRFRSLDSTLEIFGSRESLLNLSENLPFDAENPSSGINYHVHYDSISFPDFIGEGQPSLTLTLLAKQDVDPVGGDQ